MRQDEDWDALVSLLPEGWSAAATEHGALTRLRGFASAERLLRVLLIHLAMGCSLRETAARARRSGLADVSDVAILKRLRGSEAWLHHLCKGLSGAILEPLPAQRRRLVAVDATFVSEPGSRGKDWCLHYGIELPSLACLHFRLAEPKGGESFKGFPLAAGDLVLADRGYYRVPVMRGALDMKADLVVRAMLGHRNIARPGEAARFDFLPDAERLSEGACAEWPVEVLGNGAARVSGRLCVLRRSEETAALERSRTLREAAKRGRVPNERTLRTASFIGLFTSTRQEEFSAEELFAIYRFRWQVEMAFKRLKSIGHLGHLPKHDPASCRAWLYGKLLVGLLAERMARTDFFP